jgi:hypothetical protein
MTPGQSTLRKDSNQRRRDEFIQLLEEEQSTKRLKLLREIRRRKALILNTLVTNAMESTYTVIGRNPNIKRNRGPIVTRLLSLSEQQPALFKRMFRLDREDFFEQLRLITPEITRDSTNVGSTWIDPMIKLAITLRFLAGAIYLDLSWGYDIPHKTVHAYINETLVALDKANNNIKFPIDDEAELEKLEAGFADICGGIFRGTVAAGDGIVFRTDAPSPDEVGGDVTSFYCRKGFYAFGMQGFCDSKLKFLSIAMKVCTSSHDSTAYIVTELAHAIKTGQLPRRFHIVLDEAYRCTPQELCPWSGRKLDMYKDAFNYYLSLHRQELITQQLKDSGYRRPGRRMKFSRVERI